MLEQCSRQQCFFNAIQLVLQKLLCALSARARRPGSSGFVFVCRGALQIEDERSTQSRASYFWHDWHDFPFRRASVEAYMAEGSAAIGSGWVRSLVSNCLSRKRLALVASCAAMHKLDTCKWIWQGYTRTLPSVAKAWDACQSTRPG